MNAVTKKHPLTSLMNAVTKKKLPLPSFMNAVTKKTITTITHERCNSPPPPKKKKKKKKKQKNTKKTHQNTPTIITHEGFISHQTISVYNTPRRSQGLRTPPPENFQSTKL